MKLIPLYALLLVSASPFSFAAEVPLKSTQIDDLLKGNSINGVHYQKKTVQYFSESGLTLWMGSGDAKPSEGKWKVDNDKYCSDFGSGWNCFQVMNDEKQQVYYFIGADFRAPFVVQRGYDLSL